MSFEGTDVWKYSEKLVKLRRPISVSMWNYSYQIYKWKLVQKVKIKVSCQHISTKLLPKWMQRFLQIPNYLG